MATVPHPLFISSRLMAALKIPDVGTLHIEHLGTSTDNRQRYGYVLEDANGTELMTGDDISSGCGAQVDYREAMATLLSFLAAAGEARQWERSSRRTSDNGDLFPDAVMDWADQHSDELGMAELELTEQEDE